MKLKKLCVFLAVMAMVLTSCSAFAAPFKLGMLMPGKLVTGDTDKPQDISDIVLWKLYRPGHEANNVSFRFYNNLATMLMALNSGEIDELAVSQILGEYITAVNPDFAITCVGRLTGTSFVFGFKAGEGEALRNKFNAALADMRRDGVLDSLKAQYCTNPGKDKLDSVKIEKFEGAETVRVAVTGDVPPLDFVASDGEPAGFNSAILAELGRRMKINIVPVYVETASRTASLISGRTDCVFWYQVYKGAKEQPDAPEGVIFSEPYYDFNISLHVGLK